MTRISQGSTTLGDYTYDPFGRRIKKTSAAGTVYFHYDDTGLLAEYDASGALRNEYHYQPGSHWMTNPLFKRDGASGKLHYYYNSHLGQPLKLFDSSGKTTWSARSSAFGAVTATVSETDNPLRFPGQYLDQETGLHYNWHRYYDAEVGRYLRSDPIGLLGGFNFYLYGKANPLSFMDFLGESPFGLDGNGRKRIPTTVPKGSPLKTVLREMARRFAEDRTQDFMRDFSNKHLDRRSERLDRELADLERTLQAYERGRKQAWDAWNRCDLDCMTKMDSMDCFNYEACISDCRERWSPEIDMLESFMTETRHSIYKNRGKVRAPVRLQ